MTDPVLALVLIVCAFFALPAIRFFKTLDSNVWDVWHTPIAAGLAGGILLRIIGVASPVSIAIVLTLAALYVRLTGRESEPFDGMLLGAASGAAAALALVIQSETECRTLAECLVAGAVAGYGTTFASFQVTDKIRRAIIDVVTVIAAIALAYVPQFIRDDRATATAVVIAIPLIAIVAVFQQWPDVRAELGHEASLGFINDSDVRRTAHPLLRLGSGGWADRRAHREFVRLANKIALRKRQQRNRPDDIARLYQVEIIKLRMQIQEMSKIDRDVISASNSDEEPSDTMARSK
ncbi:MAG: hypothetical protein DMF58_07245 [Acidobacteria bacterium]|nr:MAG: hypothetical protein DMF58_07245 [Acidobacteriota bacterium]